MILSAVWGDVREAAAFFSFMPEASSTTISGSTESRVRRVRAVVDGVPHLFAAVVGGDDAPLLQGGIGDAADAFVDFFDGLDGGGEVAGVADHVAVGVVDDVDIVLVRGNRFEEAHGEGFGRHFGGEVVGFDVFAAVSAADVFAVEGAGAVHGGFVDFARFTVVVEEEGDVGEFFGLGGAHLGEAGTGEGVAEDVGHLAADQHDGRGGRPRSRPWWRSRGSWGGWKG